MVVLTSFNAPQDGIIHSELNTQANVQGKSLGNGVLYVAENCVSWIKETGEGFNLQYPDISLHAVSRDLTSFPQECLYLMVDTGLEDASPNSDNASDGEDDNSSAKVTEIRFVPQDKNHLTAMYQAMSDCQLLHPDPEDSISDEEEEEDCGEGGEEYFQAAGDADQLTPQGQATLQHLENIFAVAQSGEDDDEPQVGAVTTNRAGGDQEEPMETGQFEDAPEH